MPINIFDRQFFGDLDQFDTAQSVSVTITEPSYSISDGVTRKADLTRTISDVGGFTPSGFTASGFTQSEAIFIYDDITRVKGIPRSLAESFTFNDSVDRQIDLRRIITTFKTMFDDLFFGDTVQFDTESGGNISIQDTVSRKLDQFRSILESKGFTTDGFTPSGFTTEGGVQFNDVIKRNNQNFAFITEPSYSISDGITRKIDLIRNIAENYSISDVLIRQPIDFIRTISENYSINDVLSRKLDNFRNIAENYSIVDTLIRQPVQFVRTISENYSISDAVTRQINLFRNIAENITFGDGIIRQINLFRNIAETVSISDLITRKIDLGRAVSETVSILDTVVRAIFTPPKLFFVSRIKESLSVTSRIKDTEDVSI